MEPNATKPNLVLVLPDQMRGQALGFLGEEPVRTPNLHRLAAQSFVLPQAVSNMPVCSPFRAMLMTGKYPQSNKVLGNCCTRYRRVDDLLISVPDIGPTVLDLMGLGDEIPWGVEGTSYASIMLTGSGERPSSQFYVYPHPTRKDYGDRGVRTHRYTMVINRTPDDPTEQVVLFDNENDPYQLTNIAGRRPDTVRQLVEEELTPWLTRTGDPMTVAADAPREATDVGFMGGLRCDEL